MFRVSGYYRNKLNRQEMERKMQSGYNGFYGHKHPEPIDANKGPLGGRHRGPLGLV